MAKGNPKAGQREAKGTPKETKGAQRTPKENPKASKKSPKLGQRKPKGQNRVHRKVFHEKYTVVTQPKGNKSSVHQFEKWEIHPEDFVGDVLHK